MVSESNLIDIIAVTEVQSYDPGSLRLKNYSEFIKLRPSDYPLGKKGGGVLFFTKSHLYPKVIQVPNLSEYDEILWRSVRPKVRVLKIGPTFIVYKTLMRKQPRFIRS